MEILEHLDFLLHFHKNYDKYYFIVLEENLPSPLHEGNEENKKSMAIYLSERWKVFLQIFVTEDKIDAKYISELYEILIEDKYIVEKINPNSHYCITLKGRIFEGYVNQKERILNILK